MKGSQEMHLGEPSQRQIDSEGRPAVHSSCTCGALSEACCPGTEKEPLVSCTCGTRENESSEERVDRCRDVPLNLNRRAAVKSSLHDLEFEDISLREWLNTPNRIVDRTECLHIFKQILDIVSIAHSDGVVLQNIRPSCFMLSSFNRVSFIDSASCSSSGSENSFDGTGAASTVFCNKTGNPQYSRHYTEDTGQSSNVKNEGTSSDLHLPQLSSDMTVAMTPADEYREIYEDLKLSDIRKDALQATDEEDNAKQRDQSLRLKEILLTELSWYTSPEELSSGPVTFASDIYCLGVLLFELFCSFSSESEQQIIMSNLRHRLLPPQMLRRWRNEASFCLRLLHPDPSSRPNLSEIMQSEVIVSAKESLEEWQSAVNLNEKTIDTELLRDFLLHVEKQKQERIQKLSDAISFLTSDIRKVFSHHSSYMGRIVLEKPPPELEQVDEVNVSSGKASMLGKHLRQESMRTNGCSRIEMGREILSKEGQDKILSKKMRLMRNFRKLEHAYFAMRCNAKPVSPICIGRNYCGTSESDFIITKDGLNPCLLENSVGGQHGENISGRLGAFFDNLCKFLKFSKFEVKARLRQGHLLNSSDLVCSLSFDRETEYFATAGVNKKIKVFEFDTVLHEPMDISYPLIEMNGRSKFSCICWNNYINSQIASTDFEGAVRLWDIGRGQSTLELKEHSKRAWSVDFSQSDPKLLASGSDDCTMKLWSISEGRSVCTIRTKANICCVQFAPQFGTMIALGAADHKIYCYDIRNTKAPCNVLVSHSKTVSNVRFLNSTTLVSASTDNSIKLWDFNLNKGRILKNPVQTYKGHTNVKNFVGLSVADGYIATGSETNEVFLYDKWLPMPITSYKFNSADPVMNFDAEDDGTQFVSCVCWRGQTRTLIAANSNGNINILEMV